MIYAKVIPIIQSAALLLLTFSAVSIIPVQSSQEITDSLTVNFNFLFSMLLTPEKLMNDTEFDQKVE